MGFFDNPIEWAHTHFFPACSHDFFSGPRPVVVEGVDVHASTSVIQIQSNIPLDLFQLANRWRSTADPDPRSANLEDWLSRFSSFQNQRSAAGLRDQNTFFTIPSYSLSLYARVNRDELVGSYLGPTLLQANPYVQVSINGLNTQFDPLAGEERGYNLFALGRGIRAGMTADIEFRNGNFDFSLSEPVWNAINNSMRWSDVGVQINAEWLRYYIGQSFAGEIAAAESSPENLRRLLAENPLARIAYEAQRGQFRTPIRFDEVINYLLTRPSPTENRNSSQASSAQTNSPSWFERAFPQMEVGGNIQIQDYWSDGLLVLLHPHQSAENAQNAIFPSVCFTAGIQTAHPADSFYLRSHSHLDWDLVRLPGGIIFGRGGVGLEASSDNLNFRLHLNSMLEPSSPSSLPFSILDGNLRDAPEYTETTNSNLGRIHTHNIQVPSGLNIQRMGSNEYIISANLHLDTRIRMDNNWIFRRIFGVAGHEYQISTDIVADLHYRKIGNDYYLIPGFNFLRLHNLRVRDATGHAVTQGDIYFSDMHPETHTSEAINSTGQPISGFYLGAELTHLFGNIFLPVTTDGLRYDWTTAFSHIDTYLRAWQQNREYVEAQHPQDEPNFRFRVQSHSPQTCQRRVEFNFGQHDFTFFIPTLHIQDGDANGVLNLNLGETGVMDLNLKTSMEGNWNGRTASIPDWGRVFTHNPALLFGNPEEILNSGVHIALGIAGNTTSNFNEGLMDGVLNFMMSASLMNLPNHQPSHENLLESSSVNIQLEGRQATVGLNVQCLAPGAELMMGVPSDAPGYSLIRRSPEVTSPRNTVLEGSVENYSHPNPLAVELRRSR